MPPTLALVITKADSFSQDTFDAIDALVKQPGATDPSDEALKDAAAKADIPEDDLRYFLSFLSFLYVQTENIPPADLQSQLIDFLQSQVELKDAHRLADGLVRLLSYRDLHRKSTEVARHVAGFLPNLVECSAYVDMRSVFEYDTLGNLTGNVLETVPVIQFNIRTNSAKGFERDLTLQLDEKSLLRLKKEIEDTHVKLGTLNSKSKSVK